MCNDNCNFKLLMIKKNLNTLKMIITDYSHTTIVFLQQQ